MTANEVIATLEAYLEDATDRDDMDALQFAIDAVRFRSPMTVRVDLTDKSGKEYHRGHEFSYCPRCGVRVKNSIGRHLFCRVCGQKLRYDDDK